MNFRRERYLVTSSQDKKENLTGTQKCQPPAPFTSPRKCNCCSACLLEEART